MFKYGTPIKSDTCRQYWNNYGFYMEKKNEVVWILIFVIIMIVYLLVGEFL